MVRSLRGKPFQGRQGIPKSGHGGDSGGFRGRDIPRGIADIHRFVRAKLHLVQGEKKTFRIGFRFSNVIVRDQSPEPLLDSVGFDHDPQVVFVSARDDPDRDSFLNEKIEKVRNAVMEPDLMSPPFHGVFIGGEGGGRPILVAEKLPENAVRSRPEMSFDFFRRVRALSAKKKGLVEAFRGVRQRVDQGAVEIEKDSFESCRRSECVHSRILGGSKRKGRRFKPSFSFRTHSSVDLNGDRPSIERRMRNPREPLVPTSVR